MPPLKELAKRPERLTSGHRLCAGCGAPIAIRLILAAADKPVVAANATDVWRYLPLFSPTPPGTFPGFTVLLKTQLLPSPG